jgi:hypothetical protein
MNGMFFPVNGKITDTHSTQLLANTYLCNSMKIIKHILALLVLSSSLCSAQDYYQPPSRFSNTPHTHSLIDTARPKSEQFGQSSFFFSFTAGVSIPMRDFGSKDTSQYFMIPTNTDSTHAKGFANVGFHFTLKGGFSLTPNFGLMADISYNYNTFDAATLNNIINGAYYYSITGNYNIWQFMGGAFLRFEANPTTFFRIEGMLGDIRSGYPSFSVSNGSETISGTLSPASDLCYSFSLGLEEEINETVSFIAEINYTGADLSYPTSRYTYSGFGVPPVPPFTFTQNYPVTMPYGSLKFSVGVLFHF